MSIKRKILGKPFADNALFATVDSGQHQTYLLFDCGEGTCNELPVGILQKTGHLFFSHFHLDHIAGFDHFIRMNYNRTDQPVHIWGPESTTDIIYHRLNSFTWNLIGDVPSQWFIHEVTAQKITTTELRASEAFARKHFLESKPFRPDILETSDFIVSVLFLEHRLSVLGFKLQEKPRLNISKTALLHNQLPQGPYLAKLKDPSVPDETILEIEGKQYTAGSLRSLLLQAHSGRCLSYLTDFIFEEDRLTDWSAFLADCDELVCESQYLNRDLDLAKQNFHLTTAQAARMAKQAGVKKLTLIHFSRRYQHEDVKIFLDEAREGFPNTNLPEGWIR